LLANVFEFWLLGLNQPIGADMTIAQAAEKIGISSSKLYQLVAARAITHYRVGGRILLSEADIDAYLASCRVGAITQIVTAPRVQVKLKHVTLRS
jgi:excisionase family DNA binding protein